VGPHDKVDVAPADEVVDGAPVTGEWVGRPQQHGQQVLYYLHGSGYFACSPRTHRGLVGWLTRALGRPAFTLRYRMAPEHRFPAAQDDALAGYRWLLARGYRGEDIVVGGDSAGGHLAIGLLGELHRLGLPQPAGVFAFSALIDPTFQLAARGDTAESDPMVRPRHAARIVGTYLRGADRHDPRFDVSLNVGAHLPPILLQAGDLELLVADARHFATAQRATGGSCELQIWRNQVHVFQAMYRNPAAHAAIAEVQRLVGTLTPRPTPPAGPSAHRPPVPPNPNPSPTTPELT
jgi:acetyl esterase/lipase